MFKNLLFACLVITVISCDSDDDVTTNDDFKYLPLTVNNTWDYNVALDNNAPTSENLTVASVNGNEYTLSTNTVLPAGIMTGILSSGTLKAESGKLIGNGVIDFGFNGLTNFDVIYNDAVFYDQNAANGTVMFRNSDSSTQPLVGTQLNLNINYEVRTVQRAKMDQMVVNGVSYNDVIHSQLIINASISTTIILNVPLLLPQDIIVVDNYWAKDVGLIKSENQLDYTAEDLSALGAAATLPQSDSSLTVQTLVNYTVN